MARRIFAPPKLPKPKTRKSKYRPMNGAAAMENKLTNVERGQGKTKLAPSDLTRFVKEMRRRG